MELWSGNFVHGWTFWLECPSCGKSQEEYREVRVEESETPKQIVERNMTDYNDMQKSKPDYPSLAPPICKVCGGKGYTYT